MTDGDNLIYQELKGNASKTEEHVNEKYKTDCPQKSLDSLQNSSNISHSDERESKMSEMKDFNLENLKIPPARVRIASSIKQFLFLRTDLKDYSVGGLIAQACHASVDACFKFRNHPDTKTYLEESIDLTTVIYGVKINEFDKITSTLDSIGIEYIVWFEDRVEKTCIGTRPIDTENNLEFEKFRKKFRLFKYNF